MRALAVAPEPSPCWDGEDQHEWLALWVSDVGWREEWGQVAPAGRVGGSSGQLVRERVLRPQGLSLNKVWLTEAVPFFFVHRGPATQGVAMSERCARLSYCRGPRLLHLRGSHRRLVAHQPAGASASASGKTTVLSTSSSSTKQKRYISSAAKSSPS